MTPSLCRLPCRVFFSTTSSWTSQPMRAWRHRVHCGPFEKNGMMPCFRFAVAMFRCAFSVAHFLFFPLSPFFWVPLCCCCCCSSQQSRPLRSPDPSTLSRRTGSSLRDDAVQEKAGKGPVLGQLRLSTWRRRPAGDWSHSAGSCAF